MKIPRNSLLPEIIWKRVYKRYNDSNIGDIVKFSMRIVSHDFSNPSEQILIHLSLQRNEGWHMSHKKCHRKSFPALFDPDTKRFFQAHAPKNTINLQNEQMIVELIERNEELEQVEPDYPDDPPKDED
jgi:hypothetical protein